MSIQAASKVATASQNLPPADSRERFKDSEREFPSPFMGRDGAEGGRRFRPQPLMKARSGFRLLTLAV
jgi:hypothetical protein